MLACWVLSSLVLFISKIKAEKITYLRGHTHTHTDTHTHTRRTFSGFPGCFRACGLVLGGVMGAKGTGTAQVLKEEGAAQVPKQGAAQVPDVPKL